ncbi:zinc metalloproteinase/disintegrin-like, partial [Leptopilina boulardi]|uniref:zinc metalloproteinase/disintegrin-like n=1 Tax=Leptopilina boulardi TaxID=63433 RepID=UPI0021F58AE1
VMQNINYQFFPDEETGSSVTHFKNKRGISEFHGIIDNNYVIEPLSNHLRKRRDLLKKNNATFESDAEELQAPKLMEDEFMKIKSVSRREVEETPKIVYPEIIVYVDDVIFMRFEKDVMKTVLYTLSFWNGVDLLYRQFEDPKIRLYIKNIVIIKDILEFAFEANDYLSTTSVRRPDTLTKFSSFLYENQFFRPIRDYDIAMLMTEQTLIKLNTSRESTGMSYNAGVCKNQSNKYVGSAVIKNNNFYGGIINAAQKLAHIFGANNEEKDCPKKDGYIMSSNRSDKNKLLFSSCSKEAIRNVLSQDFAKCVQNNPAEYENNNQVPRMLPGEFITLDEQCLNRGYYQNVKSKTTCLELHCVMDFDWNDKLYRFEYNIPTDRIPPAEGSYCGEGRYCIAGECVQKPNNLRRISNPQLFRKSTTETASTITVA